LSAELIDNSHIFNHPIPPSKSAFTAARLKILIPFFIDLFLFTVSLFYQYIHNLKTWKGFRLLAVDGSAIRGPDTTENRYLISVHENQHGGVAATKILAIHDALNRVFTNVFFYPRAISELHMLHYNFDKLPTNAIIIYDRHYCDTFLMNRNIAITIIRNPWVFLFLKPLLSKALEKLFQLLKRYYFKIRIRPPTKRDRKHMRANERHMTEKNYKPAF